MLDKKLLKMINGKKKIVVYITILNVLNLLTNVIITALICFIMHNVITSLNINTIYIAMTIIVIFALSKFVFTILISKLKALLGTFVKTNLRNDFYKKLVKQDLNNEDINLAEITQMSIEGVEQLDLYFSMFLPHFCFAMISPIFLFAICVALEWKTATILLLCLPLIPISIILVSKYSKKIFNKYWGVYTSMGDVFLDSIKGLKDLKIFNYDKEKNIAINESAELFRKITMKVLVMQLASVTIMDLIAFGGAGVAISITLHACINGDISPFIALFLILISAEFFGNKIMNFLDKNETIWGNDIIRTIEKSNYLI